MWIGAKTKPLDGGSKKKWTKMDGTKMSNEISERIEHYIRFTDTLGENEELMESEGMLILFDRDYLFLHWSELTAEQKAQVKSNDNRLQAKHTVMKDSILQYRLHESPGDGKWWWFLDEGPQVREEMKTREKK
jgi:uncharacterized Fe-S cluster-containing radical SAM superfamily protein